MKRFWDKVNKTDSCWLWTSWTRKGYGQFYLDGKDVSAHIVAYEWANGPVPEGLVLDHKDCVRNCVRPSHLQPVTQRQNTENLSGAHKDSKSGVRGVYWHKGRNRWRAEASSHGVRYHVGYFSSVREAEEAVIVKRNQIFTHNRKDRIGLPTQEEVRSLVPCNADSTPHRQSPV